VRDDKDWVAVKVASVEVIRDFGVKGHSNIAGWRQVNGVPLGVLVHV